MNIYSKNYECRNCKTLFPTHLKVTRHGLCSLKQKIKKLIFLIRDETITRRSFKDFEKEWVKKEKKLVFVTWTQTGRKKGTFRTSKAIDHHYNGKFN